MKKLILIIICLLFSSTCFGELGRMSGRTYGLMSGSYPDNNIAIINQFPSGLTFYKDFTNGTLNAEYSLGSPVATFTCDRTGATISPGTYIDSNGVIQLMPATDDTPRYAGGYYDGTGFHTVDANGQSAKGLMVEASGTNVLTYSKDYNDTSWTKSNIVVASQNSNKTSDGILKEDFEASADWTAGGAGASVADDTTNFVSGTQSVKLSAVGGTESTMVKTVNWDLNGANFSNFTLMIYVSDITKFSSAKIELSSTDDFSQYYWANISTQIHSPGWNRITNVKSNFTKVGTNTWSSAIIRIRLTITPTSGQDLDTSFDQMYLNQTGTPIFHFAFDDSLESVYTKAFPIMETNGQKGIVYVITDLVDTAGYMTLAQLTDLKNHGWDICNHTTTTATLSGHTLADQRTQINGGYNWLIANGFGSSAPYLAYPGGSHDSNSITAAKDYHIMAFDDAGTYESHINIPYYDMEYKISRAGMLNTTTAISIEGKIDYAVITKGVMEVYNHGIVDADPTQFQTTTAIFQAVSDYVKILTDAGTLTYKIWTEYYNDYPSIINPDGSTNRLTLKAIQANGTCLRTDNATGVTYSVYLIRKSGTGDILITADSGATYDTITLSSSTWARYQVSETSASQKCGIKISTVGDEIYAWVSQFETSPHMNSTIPTTTASLTRSAETLKYPILNNRTAERETIAIKFTPYSDFANDGVERRLIATETKLRVIRKTTTGIKLRTQPNASDNTTNLADTTTTLLGNVTYISSAVFLHATNPFPTNLNYLNGILEGEDTTHGDYTTPIWGTIFTIGSSTTGTQQFEGSIAKIAIFNRALSSNEVLSVTNIFNNN